MATMSGAGDDGGRGHRALLEAGDDDLVGHPAHGPGGRHGGQGEDRRPTDATTNVPRCKDLVADHPQPPATAPAAACSPTAPPRARPTRLGARRRQRVRGHGSFLPAGWSDGSVRYGRRGRPGGTCHPVRVEHVDAGLLVLRLALGLTIAAHGYNKFFGGGRLPGTAAVRERRRATRLPQRGPGRDHGGRGGLGPGRRLFTPLSAAGVIALMLVAIVVAHRKNGFFIFYPGQGWEYCAVGGRVGFSIATIGAGDWSRPRPRSRRRGLVGCRHRARGRRGGRRPPARGVLPAAEAGPHSVGPVTRPVVEPDAAPDGTNAGSRRWVRAPGRHRRRTRGHVGLRALHR